RPVRGPLGACGEEQSWISAFFRHEKGHHYWWPLMNRMESRSEDELCSDLELTRADFTGVALHDAEGLELLSGHRVREVGDRVLVGRRSVGNAIQVLVDARDNLCALVEDVEHLADELDLHAVCNVEELREAKVGVPHARLPEAVAADE